MSLREVYLKAKAVVYSCETDEQFNMAVCYLDVAYTYCNRYIQNYRHTGSELKILEGWRHEIFSLHYTVNHRKYEIN